MDEHLKPIFQQILPEFDKRDIQYWVWGGVGIAGAKGRFDRENEDVEIIVKDSDWGQSKELLQKKAQRLDFRYILHEKYHDKFKVDLYQGRREIFSAVPVFVTDTDIDFRYGKRFPLDFLDAKSRIVGEYKFPSLKNEYLKELLICWFEKNQGKKGGESWGKHMTDARGFLSEDQIKSFQ